MAAHRIRLRGPWDRDAPDGLLRVTLPATWPADHPPSFLLFRKFGRPPVEAAGSIRLELLGVPGLVAVRLNDRELSVESTGPGDRSVILADLLARNVLALEVDLERRECPDPADGWGSIALVIDPPG